MKDTKIPWCDHTFNPWTGCERKSEGCDNCYARTMHERWNGKDSFLKRKPTSDANWFQPLRWSLKARQDGTRAKVFVGSMCDWLDLRAPDEVRTELLGLILDESLHIEWLLLTKRPECWSTALIRAMMCAKMKGCTELAQKIRMWVEGVAPKNVWFGVTAENQARWDERVQILRGIPAEVKWVSCEPLLGRIEVNAQRSTFNAQRSSGELEIDWIVAGGENGTGARECEMSWITGLWCETREPGSGAQGGEWTARVPFFFKQWGKNSVEDCSVWNKETEATREWPTSNIER